MEDLASLVSRGTLRATTDFAAVGGLDTINICVPTPLRKTKDPDMSFVAAAVDGVAAHLHPGMLVVLESTTYPGTTKEFVKPRLEAGSRSGRSLHPDRSVLPLVEGEAERVRLSIH